MKELVSGKFRYKILKIAGEGLTSTVYKALRIDQDGLTSQVVAVKVPKDRTWIPNLRREFEKLTQVESINCARTLFWESFENHHALVMEWIEGISLLELARSSDLSSALKTEIIVQIEAGLIDLHVKGFHHGDLNPCNVMIDTRGTIKLLDASGDRENIESATLAYMSPEQFRGEFDACAADWFALGLLEDDLDTNFLVTPGDAVSARLRSCEAVTNGHSYLHPNERQRAASGRSSDSKFKSELSRIVRELMEHRQPTFLRTIALASRQHSVLTRRGAVSAAILIFMSLSLSVSAEAPIQTERKLPAVLKFTSHHWIELELNGRPIGYAPVEVRGLSPGAHRIRIRSKAKSGEFYIQLQSGERRVLEEKTLLRLAQARKH